VNAGTVGVLLPFQRNRRKEDGMRKARCTLGAFLLVLAGCGGSTARGDNTCPAGTAKWSNGHCYEAVLAPGLSWVAAHGSCQGRGGHLATNTSAAENAFVFGLVSGNNAFWYLDLFGNGLGPWLGGTQPDGSQEPGGGWQWVTGEPFAYTNWEAGQPDNGGGAIDQNRLRFFKKGGLIGDRWDDSEADNPVAHRLGYVCEHD
jgi:hypothetical protein